MHDRNQLLRVSQRISGKLATSLQPGTDQEQGLGCHRTKQQGDQRTAEDRYMMQGCATLGVRLWCYTGNVDRTDPAAALTEYGWRSGKEVARHNGAKVAGWTGSGIWEAEGMATVKDGVIKVWYGIVRADREYLIFRRMETIEQHARELLDLLHSEDPQEDSC
jgi:hypothetical protein